MWKHDHALSDYTQATKPDPINQDVSYLWRGVFFLEQGNKRGVIKDFQKVIDLTYILHHSQQPP
ncbi:MAG: hypothetical protein NW224_24310 [Leptolyngbyaceae cyanobacterium bins.302]|nr:hypothetical protein [Leptolyngbyaceae cyanobacterium bins.302]